ncbi:MAG: 5-formyltetrahydrofolate cyclo-ligase [Desulfovibrionaceae bacterium]|nr:5-formyltetrahydrofolate cyclo-ligase [Desulfovibrionaceae bacterium]
MTASEAEARAALRQAMKKARSAQDPAAALAASHAAQRHLMAAPLWQTARSAALYAATRGECGTDLLLADAYARGMAVWLPRVRKGAAGVMDFARVEDLSLLVTGSFGILEPPASLPGVPARDFACDVAVIPGVAFAPSGARLGFGGGYYDRFFSLARTAARVGLGFAFQMAEDFRAEPWDVPMTHLCTERGLACVPAAA